jgi:glycosyltransferase involved in cell wall biosynthesis
MKGPTVFLNGRFLTQRVTGVQRYAREVLLALDTLLAEDPELASFDLELLVPEGTPLPELRAIRARAVGPFSGNLWEQLTLPWIVRKNPLFGFSATGPLFKARQIVTLHDASVRAVPEAFSLRFRAWYRLVLGVLLRRARSVVTVSEFSRREITHHFGCDAGKLRVAVEGSEHVLRADADVRIVSDHGLVPGRYVLGVSSPTPNKNFRLLIEAVKRLEGSNFDVVIAGSTNHSVLRAELPRSDRVKYVGYVTDGELRALYEHAGVFVYPSLYEGFGIPALEAMACGCPVIASNAASLPEVCGDAAIYVSPRDPAGLAAAIERVMSDETERRRLGERGRERVQRYRWSSAAHLNLEFMRALFDGPAEQALD